MGFDEIRFGGRREEREESASVRVEVVLEVEAEEVMEGGLPNTRFGGGEDEDEVLDGELFSVGAKELEGEEGGRREVVRVVKFDGESADEGVDLVVSSCSFLPNSEHRIGVIDNHLELTLSDELEEDLVVLSKGGVEALFRAVADSQSEGGEEGDGVG